MHSGFFYKSNLQCNQKEQNQSRDASSDLTRRFTICWKCHHDLSKWVWHVEIYSTYTALYMFTQVLFLAGNHNIHKTWFPSILLHNLCQIVMGMKQKKWTPKLRIVDSKFFIFSNTYTNFQFWKPGENWHKPKRLSD